jgi:uncharacterized protein
VRCAPRHQLIAVIDSNVLVAGLLSKRADSPVCRILDGMVAAEFGFAVSIDLIAEYHRVLRYPKVARLHGLGDSQINDLLSGLILQAQVREPVSVEVEINDPADVFLFELLASLNSGVLVTGDKRLLAQAPDWASVVGAGSFCSLLR